MKSTEGQTGEMVSKLKDNDHYTVLGIGRNSTPIEIKQAYRKLALRYHPDKNSDPLAKEVFKKVADSYTTLMDVEKRAEVDRERQRHTYQYQEPKKTYTQPSESYRFAESTNKQRSNTNPRPPPSNERDTRQPEFPRKQKTTVRDTNPREMLDSELEDLIRNLLDRAKKMRSHQTAQAYQRANLHRDMRTGKRLPPPANLAIVAVGVFFLVGMLISNIILPKKHTANKPASVPTKPQTQAQASYSLFSTSLYKQKMHTSLLRATYYVQAKPLGAAVHQPLKQVEEQVDTNFLSKIRLSCSNNQQLKLKYQSLSVNSKGAMRRWYKQKGEEVSDAACIRLEHLRQKFPEYLSSLKFE